MYIFGFSSELSIGYFEQKERKKRLWLVGVSVSPSSAEDESEEQEEKEGVSIKDILKKPGDAVPFTGHYFTS